MLTDAELVDRVTAGFDGAFEELYRRHVQGAWRLGQAITGNSHDAADAVSEAFARVLVAIRDGRLENGDAFRAYLLTATRNAGLDSLRRGTRSSATDDESLADLASSAPTPDEVADDLAEAALLGEAFRNLPERWRSVLWLTEVEGLATKDVAEQLGLSANGTAQLAVRARAGLRERFLQAHLRRQSAPGCRFCVDRLGAYVGGSLSPRDLAKVDQHLAACEECRARKDELDDLGAGLRRVALPLPITLGAIAAERATAALRASGTAPGTVRRLVKLATEPTPMTERVLGGAAAGIFAIGVLAAGVLGRGGDDADVDGGPTASRPPAAVSLVNDQLERVRPTSTTSITGRSGSAVTPAPTTGQPAGTGAASSTPAARRSPATKSTPSSPTGEPGGTGSGGPDVGAVADPLKPVIDLVDSLLAPVAPVVEPVVEQLPVVGGTESAPVVDAPAATEPVTGTVGSVLGK